MLVESRRAADDARTRGEDFPRRGFDEDLGLLAYAPQEVPDLFGFSLVMRRIGIRDLF